MENRLVMHEIAPSSEFENIVLTKAMYAAIRSHDEQAFDMSEESGKKNTLR